MESNTASPAPITARNVNIAVHNAMKEHIQPRLRSLTRAVRVRVKVRIRVRVRVNVRLGFMSVHHLRYWCAVSVYEVKTDIESRGWSDRGRYKTITSYRLYASSMLVNRHGVPIP